MLPFLGNKSDCEAFNETTAVESENDVVPTVSITRKRKHRSFPGYVLEGAVNNAI